MKKWWRPQRKLSVWSSLRNFRRVFIQWLVMQEKCSPAVSASVFLWRRAILKDAPIVVLDEATAYADPENEEKMEAAIAELVKGKTLVVIAHKLPAIMNADQICVMDHGKLVATGKHQELIQSCPEYQKVVESGTGQRRVESTYCKGGKLNVCFVFKNIETFRPL